MNKTTWLIVFAVIIVVIFGTAIYLRLPRNQNQLVAQTGTAPIFDPLNATYVIEGKSVALVNGKAETPAAPGSATQIATMIFGQPANGDLNDDGNADAAVILVQNPGGSGTFYYVAAAINVSGTTQGTNAILLGDRIAPQNILIDNRQIVVNYADRKPGQPFSTSPSVGITKYLLYNGSMLQESPSRSAATSSAPVANPGERCGGNMTTAPVCTSGYHCAPAPGSHLPFGDVGGTCVKN